MSTVTSKDGTAIGYERHGSGPPLILVGGGLVDRSENSPLALELAEHFTVYNYDRRGRGGSGDTLPYAVEREIEDLDALLAEAGGTAHLYGVSSGGALVLEAAAAGLAVGWLAVYEVPYAVGDEAVGAWQDYRAQLEQVLAAGHRGDALTLFMRLAGSSEEDIAGARSSPWWPSGEAIAHTLAYDAACVGDGPVPATRLTVITRPALIMIGAELDPHMAALSPDFFAQAADEIAASMPGAHRRTLSGQTHVADPKTMAAVLGEFFRE